MMAGSDIQEAIQGKINEIRELRNTIADLNVQVGQLEIKAPMDGIVAALNKQVGDSSSPGEWIGYLYTVSDMRMWTEVDDIDILLVKQGAPVNVTVDAIPGEIFEGTVENVSTMGNQVNGMSKFGVEMSVKGNSGLRPGMQAKAFIDAGSSEDVLLIPLEAIFEEDNKSMVEVLGTDGIIKLMPVKLGLMNDRYAEVESGLEEGDLVVTGSTADLLPSQHIKSENGILPEQSQDDGGNDDSGQDQ